MDVTKLIEIFESAFGFLEEAFNFQKGTVNIRDCGVEIIFKNATTGVRVWYEYREFWVFVYLCQLISKDLVLPSGEMQPSTRLYCYDLEDLVAIRASESVNLTDDVRKAETLERYIHRQAQNLENYAPDVLLGDFSVFCQLDKMVKARAKKAASEKWGERAEAYGW